MPYITIKTNTDECFMRLTERVSRVVGNDLVGLALRRSARIPVTTQPRPQEARMGARTDKIIGRSKQALGAVTGNKRLKREGQRQEDKGKLKAQVDSTIGKTQDALEDLKDKADRS